MRSDDDAILDAFIASHRRDRWRASLADLSRRDQMLARLHHCKDLDVRHARLLPSNAPVLALLRERGAPRDCYVLSFNDEFDGRTMPLAEAIEATHLGNSGTILSCIPGKLAYYYDECGERRMLLERPPHRRPF